MYRLFSFFKKKFIKVNHRNTVYFLVVISSVKEVKELVVRNMKTRRGDIFYADLSPVMGSEQGGVRPVVIIQNNTGNKYSPTVIVAAITSQVKRTSLPTHVAIKAGGKYRLPKNSIILGEQIRTIDKKRLREKIGYFDEEKMRKLDEALKISLGIQD